MRFSKKHEKLNQKSREPFGVSQFDSFSNEDEFTYELSTETGFHGRDFMKLKERLKRT